MTDESDGRVRDATRVAEHVISHERVGLYLLHLMLEELTVVVIDKRTHAHNVQDALRSLTARR